ncbi:MAG: M23 family metallopeptidase [Roseburia sp.]|nr:M23 family metallopeptidase [Roseburia sp.]MCM1420466.1 M23 family metallopeptidase [Bacteroides sp.]
MIVRNIFILLCCCSTLSAYAQFNTISMQKGRYAVEVASRNTKAGENVPKKEMVPVSNEKDTIDKRKEWLERYMSVSYPLRRIVVTSDYGERIDPITRKKSFHNGIDLRAAEGEEVFAMMFGKVVKVGSDKRSGNYVILRHGDFTVSYCHLSKCCVKRGDCVRPGNVVGISGSTGRATGAHLHLTVRMGRRHINPGTLLQFVDETRKLPLYKLTE